MLDFIDILALLMPHLQLRALREVVDDWFLAPLLQTAAHQTLPDGEQ